MSDFDMKDLTHTKVIHLIKYIKTTDKLKAFLKALMPWYRMWYPNLATLNVKLSQVRKVIKETLGKEYYDISNTSIFSIKKNEQDSLNDNYSQAVEQKNNNRIPIKKEYLLERIKFLKKNYSNDIYDLGVLLLIISGMRPIELFTNVVSLSPSKSGYVRFSNIAKKKDKEASVDRPIINTKASEFIELLNKFRSYFTELISIDSNGVLAKDKAQALNRSVKKHFKEITGRQSSSIMRKYYALLSHDMYGSNIEFQHFIKNTLGHESLEESFSYSYYKLEGKTPSLYTKAQRTTPKNVKEALLEQIYNDHPNGISIRKMKELSGLGTTAISLFLKNKRSD